MRIFTYSSLLIALAVGCFLGAPAMASQMDFSIVPFGDAAKCGAKCPEVISAVGEITNDTPKQFLQFVAHNLDDPRLRSIVFLHSPGGGVAASMRLGQMFRKTGVMAVVARIAPSTAGSGAPAMALPGGRCFSACVYALMGGKKRVVPPDSLVGIHRMFFEEPSHDSPLLGVEEKPQREYGTPAFVAQLAKYASSMGVSRQVIWTAEQINPDKIHIVTAQELRRWNLGTQKF